jgi:hypothetical protein
MPQALLGLTALGILAAVFALGATLPDGGPGSALRTVTAPTTTAPTHPLNQHPGGFSWG